jgi:hypothetical protein
LCDDGPPENLEVQLGNLQVVRNRLEDAGAVGRRVHESTIDHEGSIAVRLLMVGSAGVREDEVIGGSFLVCRVGDQSNPGGKHMEAKGTFEVKSNPQEATAFEKSMGVERYEIDKIWLGDLFRNVKGRDVE